jgi:putative ABC transport system permease protein
MIASHPWFAATVIATLALCMGVNTTVFTLVNAVLFKPVPIPGGERLVTIVEQDAKNPKDRSGVSLPEYLAYREQTKTLSNLEASSTQQAIVSEKGNPPQRYSMAAVTAGLFEMLKTPPILGRPIHGVDCQAGTAPVVLIGYSVWRNRYLGSPDVIGRSVRLNGVPTTIVGVMPEGFRFPQVEDLWTPLVPTKEREDRTHRNLMVFGLLAPGAGMDSAQSELGLISARIAKAFPETEKDMTALVQTFHEAFNGGPVKLMFLLMLGAVGFVLLIACANVANMMLSRALARSREIALRAALGASRWQIIRQLLVESVILSVIGGLVGLVLAQFGVHAFDIATQDVGKPYWVQFTMDWRAFTYFAALSIGSGLVFGIVPAWRASRVDLNTALKDGTVGGTQRAGRLSGILVVFQFALTVVLLAGAGVMIKSFLDVQRINPFVPAAHIFTARVSLPDGKGERYESVESRRKMHDTLMERLAGLPGVTQAALASYMPGLGSQYRDMEVEGVPNPDPKHPPRAAAVFATPNYLPEIGLPIQSGRSLNDTDGLEGREAAVVTRDFASQYWPGASPVGRRFRFITDGKPAAWITVVGVCGNVAQNMQDKRPPPLVYLSDRQEPWAWLGIMLRASGDPSALTASVRSAVQDIDPDLPLFEAKTLPAAIEHDNWFLKVFGSVFLLFAVIALLMASVGIYAVVAQATSRRTREIGIRMALGASARKVVQLVLARGVLQLGIGLAIGLVGAIAATRLMSSLPVISSTNDPIIFVVVVALLTCVGLFACYLPARRAARVAPTEALRTD